MSLILSDQFRKALDYAANLHSKQTRKGNDIPYISHLMAVTSIVIENGKDEDEVIAALLHDGPEDQGGEPTLLKIKEMFGERVADIVLHCSDTLEEEKEEWQIRKTRYLEHLSGNRDESVLLVSLADKIHNARSILADYQREGEPFWDRFNSGKGDILWYYKSLLNSYRGFGKSPYGHLVDEFDSIVEHLFILCGINDVYSACIRDKSPDFAEESLNMLISSYRRFWRVIVCVPI